VFRMYCGESAAKQNGADMHKAINVNKPSMVYFRCFIGTQLSNICTLSGQALFITDGTMGKLHQKLICQ
jgi:hypothetical protein